MSILTKITSSGSQQAKKAQFFENFNFEQTWTYSTSFWSELHKKSQWKCQFWPKSPPVALNRQKRRIFLKISVLSKHWLIVPHFDRNCIKTSCKFQFLAKWPPESLNRQLKRNFSKISILSKHGLNMGLFHRGASLFYQWSQYQ